MLSPTKLYLIWYKVGDLVLLCIKGPGVGECSPCPAGSFVQGESCEACAAGTFSLEGATVCATCDPSTISEPGADTCTPCEDSFVEVDNVSREICPPGTCQAGEVNQCITCFAGLFQPQPGQAFCRDCPRGSFQPLEGQTMCDQCPAMYVQPFKGKTVCIECPNGSIEREGEICVDDPDMNSCVGGYIEGPGFNECSVFPAGTYELRGKCTECAAGTFSGEGATICISCDPSMVSAPGADTCKTCDAGAVEVDNVKCYICQPGTSQSGEACIPCAAGLHQPDAGETVCLPCLPGSYQPLVGAKGFAQCLQDFVQPLEVQTVCIGCSEGDIEGE
jgi:hypothetical protein